jgi:hypothetical protein
MSNSVYFRRIRINEETQSATIIVSSQPLKQAQAEIAGFQVGARTQQEVSFGILALTDPKTGKSLNANHPTIKGLQAKLNAGDEMPGWQLSTSPVVNQETGLAIPNLYWVEPA